jgi:F0F1-type ATP synthase membrane subunit c/vacuolar-type H+-ATPase subunit K
MDSTKDRIYTIGTALLVGLAGIIGGMAIHQEFFEEPDMTAG